MDLRLSTHRPSLFVAFCLLLLLFSFYKKGSYELQEWDESRNGVNAYEMLENRDYVNLYFNHELDTWNAKPPLLIWAIAGSYKLFGYNEFALRFPTTICILLFFIVLYLLIKTHDGKSVAVWTCLVLVSCKAIFGVHVGLTADFDAMLLFFLTASVYSFIQYVDLGKTKFIIICALFLGLAFYTKGTASLVLIPGFVIYLFFRKKTEVFRDRFFWLAGILFIGIVVSWLSIYAYFGKTSERSFYSSGNSVTTMLYHDTFRRLTSTDFEYSENNGRDLLFFFEVLDARMNVWNYIFYASLLCGAFIFLKNKTPLKDKLGDPRYRLILLSFCLILPLALLLSFATNKNHWYMAPLYPFIAYLTVKGIFWLTERFVSASVFVWILMGGLLVRQMYYVYSLPTTNSAIKTRAYLSDSILFVPANLSQDMILYLKWLNLRTETLGLSEPAKVGSIFLINNRDAPTLGNFETMHEFGNYTIARLNSKP